MRHWKSALAAMALAFSWTATAGAQSKIVLGTAPNMQTAYIVIAMENGLFKKEGLDVETVKFVAGRRALEALLGGQLDLAFMAEYPPVIAALRKQKFAVVTGISKYVANRVVSRSDVGFSSVKDLAGKKIGTTLGTNAAFFTELLLTKAGVKAEIVNVAPPDIVPALARGDIDAGVMFPDFYPKAKQMLGDKYREQRSSDYEAYFVLAASPAMLTKRQDDLKKFLSALIKADEIMKKDPAAAKAAIVKATEGLLSAETVEKSWPDFEYKLGLYKDLLDTMEAEAKWIQAKGLIKGATADRAKLRGYIADGPMKSLDPSRVSLDK
jgi:NitT/TauT family transport system substrate-binding protein